MSFILETRIRLAPGKYVIADPCYVIRNEDWYTVLTSCNYFNDSPVGTVGIVQIIAFPTEYGDGTYQDNLGNWYGVDAGLIGIIPEEWASKHYPSKNNNEIYHVHEFTKPFWCYTENGKIHFGHIVIDTDPDFVEKMYDTKNEYLDNYIFGNNGEE